MAAFGKDIMAKEFMLNVDDTFLNQGSFGVAPRRVLDDRIGLIREMEQEPDTWFRWKAGPKWDENVQAASDFLGSEPTNLVFVHNTSSGINAVLRSLPFESGDAILLYSWSYFSVVNTATYMASMKGLEVLYVDIPMPLLTVQSLLDAYESMLQAHANIKIVVLDQISSVPSVLMPLPELIALCRRYEKLVFVDGAHGPGQLELNLETMGVDFYAGTLGKWAYAPRGCGILWIHPDYHSVVFPVITANMNPASLKVNYQYNGTADYTTYYAVSKAIQFYKEIGGFSAISAYCSDLVERGANHLVLRWGTRHLDVPSSMRTPFMRLVRLPDIDKYRMPANPQGDIRGRSRPIDMAQLTKDIWDRFKIASGFAYFNDEPWCRIAASVYNELEDYEKLAAAVLILLSEQQQQQRDQKEGK